MKSDSCRKGHNNWSSWTSTNGSIHRYCKTCRQSRARTYSKRKKASGKSHTRKEFLAKLATYEKCQVNDKLLHQECLKHPISLHQQV